MQQTKGPTQSQMGEFIKAFRKMMFSTDMGLWTIFCSAEVIKSNFES